MHEFTEVICAQHCKLHGDLGIGPIQALNLIELVHIPKFPLISNTSNLTLSTQNTEISNYANEPGKDDKLHNIYIQIYVIGVEG